MVFLPINLFKNELMTKLETTQKVQKLRLIYGDKETAEKIGVSRNTMYKRIDSHKWKITEISHIEKLLL